MATTTLVESALMLPDMAKPKGKSLTPEQNARVREAVRKLVKRHGGNITRTAEQERLEISQAGLSSFLSERTGAGMQLVTSVARAMQINPFVLINGHDSLPDPPPMRPVLGNLPGYEEAEAHARTILRTAPEWVWQEARNVSAARFPERADAELIMKAVALVRDYPPPTGDTPETQAAKREIARLKSKALRK